VHEKRKHKVRSGCAALDVMQRDLMPGDRASFRVRGLFLCVSGAGPPDALLLCGGLCVRRALALWTAARDPVSGDVTFFGTAMVAMGHADGMVSGAVHTTAATVRPALQLSQGTGLLCATAELQLYCHCTVAVLSLYCHCTVIVQPRIFSIFFQV